MILCTTSTPEQIKAQQALVASHASAGSFGAIVGFTSGVTYAATVPADSTASR